MRMFRFGAVLAALLLPEIALAADTTLAVTAGSGTAVSVKSYGSGDISVGQLVCDPATEYRCATVTASNALKVDGSAVTQPVSNAGTFATQAASTQSGTWTMQPGNTANTTAWLVTGTGGTFPVTSATFATAAKQPALGTAGTASADVISVQGIASMTALQTDVTKWGGTAVGSLAAPGQFVNIGPIGSATAVDQNSGTKSAGTQRVVLATDQPQLTNKLLVTPDANSAVNVSQINGVTPLMGNGATGTGSHRVTLSNDSTAIAGWGQGATAASVPSGATMAGGRAQNAEPTAVTNGQLAAVALDLAGKQITLPYANPENFLDGTITTSMTGTTSTAVSGMGAQAAGVRNYVTACMVSNAHATVGTDVVLQDGSGGTTLWTLPAAAAYGGASQVFPTPLKTTAATALFAANVTTGASTKLSCTGYKGI